MSKFFIYFILILAITGWVSEWYNEVIDGKEINRIISNETFDKTIKYAGLDLVKKSCA